MTLPTKIDVGPLQITVSESQADFQRMVVEDATDTWGYARYGECLIVLKPAQAESHKRMVLLHELMHFLWHAGDRLHKEDETAISVLAAPLLDTLRRNPALVAYLMEAAA